MGDSAHLLLVLVFDASDDVCMKRCMGRKREDDKEDVFRDRIEQFHSECEEVIRNFANRGLVRRVAAEKSTEEVWEAVKSVMLTEKLENFRK